MASPDTNRTIPKNLHQHILFLGPTLVVLNLLMFGPILIFFYPSVLETYIDCFLPVGVGYLPLTVFKQSLLITYTDCFNKPSVLRIYFFTRRKQMLAFWYILHDSFAVVFISSLIHFSFIPIYTTTLSVILRVFVIMIYDHKILLISFIFYIFCPWWKY